MPMQRERERERLRVVKIINYLTEVCLYMISVCVNIVSRSNMQRATNYCL